MIEWRFVQGDVTSYLGHHLTIVPQEANSIHFLNKPHSDLSLSFPQLFPHCSDIFSFHRDFLSLSFHYL
jgi:hypothetical protein